jgi:pantothenate kinase type III
LNPDLRFDVEDSSAKRPVEEISLRPFWDLLTEITLNVSSEIDLFERASNWIRTAGAPRTDALNKFVTMNAVVVSDSNELILKKWCESRSIYYRRLVKRPLRLVRSRYDLIQMGDDRFFAIEAAMALSIHENINGSLMIVSLGTATTIDFVDRDRVHHGGQIGVGINTGLSALSEHTSRLPILALDATSIRRASHTAGLNTKDAMTTAAVSMQCHWILGERKSFAARIGAKPEEVTIILSGGLSQEMERELLFLMTQENPLIQSKSQSKKPSANILNVRNLVQLGALLGAISQ